MPRVLNPDMAAEDFQAYFEKVFEAGITPVSVGGDHSVTWPILRAARQTRFRAPLGVIHFDSHTDAYPAVPATRNHAGGFRMGAEDGVIDPRRTVQIGIRGPVASLEQDNWAKEHFAQVITTAEFMARGGDHVLQQVRRVIGDGPAYLSFDLAGLDPAYAPGVADPEVDGLTLREVMQLLHGLRGVQLIGADFVCYCPPLDNPAQIRALTISLLMLEAVTLIADYKRSRS
jgi:guanidinopropionase